MPTTSVSPPPDATQVHGWTQRAGNVPARVFEGTVREAAGFAVRVGGFQLHTGACKRWVTVETEFRLGVPMEPEAARQLAGVLVAAADEIEARR